LLLNNVTVAAFTDADLDVPASDFTALVNWGDGTGSSPGIVRGANGSFSVSGNHAYAAAGAHTLGVTVTDTRGRTAVGGTASVSAVPSYQVATFTDSNPNDTATDFTATITTSDDPTPTPGVISGGNGQFSVSSDRVFANAGTVGVTVSIFCQGILVTTVL